MNVRPTLRQLEYFSAVARTLSFQTAASEVGVSQPGLSAQIREMEGLLGTRLFERSTRSVLLTEAGRLLLPRARRIVSETSEFVAAAAAACDPASGRLQLGAIPTVAPYLLPQALPEVRRRWPKLRLLLHEDTTEKLLERLAGGELDLLLLDVDVDLGNAASLPLFREEFLLAVPASHRLGHRTWVREGDLAGENVLLLEEGHCMRGHGLSLCQSAGAGEGTDFRASSLTTLIQTVASGMGVTLVPEMAAVPELRSSAELQFVRFRRPAPSRTVGLAWRKMTAREDLFCDLAAAFG